MTEVENNNALTRFCTKCCNPIDQKRVTRGSFYCSDGCRSLDKNQRRQRKAERFCRLCGRPPKRIRVRKDLNENNISIDAL